MLDNKVTPRYDHDCHDCTFMGTFYPGDFGMAGIRRLNGPVDAYVHVFDGYSGNIEFVLRQSSAPEDYLSPVGELLQAYRELLRNQYHIATYGDGIVSAT